MKEKEEAFEEILFKIIAICNKERDICNKDASEKTENDLKLLFRMNYEKTKIALEAFIEKRINEEEFKYLCKRRIIDNFLIKEWKIHGQEKLCCVKCIHENYIGKKCICRVPKKHRAEDFLACNNCGCKGCR